MEAVLRKLGLTTYEVSCLVALARVQEGGASLLAKESGVPRSKVYEILYDLIRAGLVMEVPSSPKKFRIASLERLKDLAENRRREAEDLEEQTLSVVSSLQNMSAGKSSEPMWIIKGQKQIVDRIRSAIVDSKQETIACVRSLVDSGAVLRDISRSVNRGVNHRMLFVASSVNMAKVSRYLRAGVSLRAYDEGRFGEQGMRFSVFDERLCRITIGKPEVLRSQDYTTLWSDSPALCRMLKRQFESLWSTSDDVTL